MVEVHESVKNFANIEYIHDTQAIEIVITYVKFVQFFKRLVVVGACCVNSNNLRLIHR